MCKECEKKDRTIEILKYVIQEQNEKIAKLNRYNNLLHEQQERLRFEKEYSERLLKQWMRSSRDKVLIHQ